MKIRDSGMPDEELWAFFFDVPGILSNMAINARVHEFRKSREKGQHDHSGN